MIDLTIGSVTRRRLYSRRLSQLAMCLVVTTGGVVLLGWWIDSAPLKGVFSGFVSMNPATAIVFILCGLSGVLQTDSPSGGFKKTLASFCAAFALFIGLLKIFSFVGWDSSIDQVLFREKLNSTQAHFPNRMAPNTVVGCLLSALALLLRDRKTRRGYVPAQFIIIPVLILAFLTLLGYAYSSDALLGVQGYIPMAINTAVAFFIFSVGIFCMYPDRGLVATLTENSAAGLMCRRLIPAVIVLSVSVGWLRLHGQRLNLYGTEFGAALMAISSIVILVTLILWHARSLGRMEKDIYRNEAFLESIIENIPNMIFVKEAKELRFVRFNKAGEELLGYPRHDLIGKNDYDLFPRNQAEFFVEHDRKVLNTGSLLDVPEETIDTKFNGPRILHTKKLPVTDEAGAPLYLLGISEDITARKQADEQVRALNQKLKENLTEIEAVNKELEAFSYSVSHDLRAPLRSMAGFSQALLEDHAHLLNDQGKNYLKRISDAGQRMGLLIDGLLNLSRLARKEMRRDEVDISALARTVAADLSKADPARCVEFVAADGVRALGDAQLLQIALDNLLGNAWKFTGKQNAPKIEFGRTEKDGEPVYFVRDNGAGFDIAYADKLFGAFQRLHSAAEFSGTGIGLATVQRIIHRHGGKIWAESAVGQGTTFYFTL